LRDRYYKNLGLTHFCQFGDWRLVRGDWEKYLLPQAFFIAETLGTQGL
jgi:hypothetical protein